MERSAVEGLLRCARGEAPADLLLENGRLVCLESGEVLQADLAVLGDRIVGLGARPARQVIDLAGAYMAPGLIDAHVHVESSLVTPAEFGRAVLPSGTTSVVTDPHEIANVFGLDGVRFMLDDAQRSPLAMLVMAPSCVPASAMETSGARLEAAELATLIGDPRVLGLAEVMSFPDVVAGEASVLDKLQVFRGRVVDGHCPGLHGQALEAYIAAGIGSDHECTTADEAREKVRLGLTVFLRQATGARNLSDLLPAVTPKNHHRFCLCTDDRQPADLLDDGHIDGMVRTAIASGLDPIVALRLGSSNTAAYFGLEDRGSLAPGKRADLIVFDELAEPRPRLVFAAGQLVARDGECLEPFEAPRTDTLAPSIHIAWDEVDFQIRAKSGPLRVIGIVPDQLVTESLVEAPTVRDGLAVSDPSRDLVKLAVIERHRATGAMGKGFVRGLGLERGALASSVAHDHHNLVVVGADDDSMELAARRAAALGGGLVVATEDEVLAEVPLPIAGLMSDRPIGEVRRQLDAALEAARRLGSPLRNPFMTLSFLALEVIPSLKLTDQGLIDVDRFCRVPLWME